MKKICLMAIALLSGYTAMAQVDLVKDVEHQLKASNPDYAAALKAIQPALTNPATENSVNTWLVAAEAAIGCYDKASYAFDLGENPSADVLTQGARALVDGCNYYLKALKLDSVPDEKGKIKPKHSKKILKKLADNYGQVRRAGGFLYNAGDLDNAFDAWELYYNLPKMPELAKAKIQEHPDSLVAEVLFSQGYIKLRENDNKVALQKMLDAIDHNTNNVYAYVCAVEAARLLDDTETMGKVAEMGYEKYGSSNIDLVGLLINYYLSKDKLDESMALVDDGIANTPEDNKPMLSQLWDMKGYLLEKKVDDDSIKSNSYPIEERYADAKQCYEYAIQLDPTNAKAYFDLGRMLHSDAEHIRADNLDNVTPELIELYLKCADLLKEAYRLDSTVGNGQIPGVLWRLYYGLGEDYQYDSDEWEAIYKSE